MQKRRRVSAVTFDPGRAGVRVSQIRTIGKRRETQDVLALPIHDESELSIEQAAHRLARLMGQGDFSGRTIGLTLTPPHIAYHALRIPGELLAQPASRVREALAWEVARETRVEPNEIEVRYWPLPQGHRQGLNVLATSMSAAIAGRWFAAFAEQGLHLRRIDSSVSGLVRLACAYWPPASQELWGILDLGAQRTNFSVMIGRVPTYIRSLPVGSDPLTTRISEGFELTQQQAEQIKRRQGIRLGENPNASRDDRHRPRDDENLSSVVFGLVRDPLEQLVSEIERCSDYVMKNFADLSVSRLVLAGGGALLGGLDEYLETILGVPVVRLASSALQNQQPSDRPLGGVKFDTGTAAVTGAALLDLESR